MLLYLTEQIQLDMQAKRGCTWLMPVYCIGIGVASVHWKVIATLTMTAMARTFNT